MTSDLPSDAAKSRAEQGRMVRLRSGQAPDRVWPDPDAEDTIIPGEVGSAEGVASSGSWAAKHRIGWYVAIGAACASLISFLTYSHRGDLLLFGDAVAHINIARRVFDSRAPGLLQLGTVWLPLPHLLMMPFVVSRWMWRTSVGASVPSMIAYVFGAVGVFRLVHGAMRVVGRSHVVSQRTAIFAAAIFSLNPNLLYMQVTAMTEALYLALFIWAVVYFSEFSWAIRESAELPVGRWQKSLRKCGLCLLGACLTRYDGWFVAGVLGACVLFEVPRLASKERART